MDPLLYKTPWRKIPGFPYPERFCPYCEHPLTVWKALHINGQEEHYKAVMICLNKNCGAYDEEARNAYARVYYSSEFAHKTLELQMTGDPRKWDERLRRT